MEHDRSVRHVPGGCWVAATRVRYAAEVMRYGSVLGQQDHATREGSILLDGRGLSSAAVCDPNALESD